MKLRRSYFLGITNCKVIPVLLIALAAPEIRIANVAENLMRKWGKPLVRGGGEGGCWQHGSLQPTQSWLLTAHFLTHLLTESGQVSWHPSYQYVIVENTMFLTAYRYM
jgi:hypothetical protein